MAKKIKNQLGYHIVFGNIYNSENQKVGSRFGSRIYTEDSELINDLMLPVPDELHRPNLNRAFVVYTICEKETKEALAHIDIRGNIFNLNGDYIGSVRNYVALISAAVILIALAIVTTILAILAIRISKGETIDSEIVIKEYETVITDEWRIFGTTEPEKLIYPGKRGKYTFTIENGNDINVSVIFDIKDYHNEIDVPMKYRLIGSDGYICGDENTWVDAIEVEFYFELIKAQSKETYILEWMWDGSNDELDTFIGTHGGIYELKVEVISTITLRGEE